MEKNYRIRALLGGLSLLLLVVATIIFMVNAVQLPTVEEFVDSGTLKQKKRKWGGAEKEKQVKWTKIGAVVFLLSNILWMATVGFFIFDKSHIVFSQRLISSSSS